MVRTAPRKTNGQPQVYTQSQMMAFASELVGRANLAAKLGFQYGGNRDIYQALGYDLDITYTMYAARYDRQDIAKAVIDRPVNYTWKGPLVISEAGDDEETALEKEWKKLEKELKLKSKFIRLDKLSSIGNYGVLLLGFDDIKIQEDWKKPVTAGTRKLKYVKPLGEGHAKIQTYVSETKDERYGMVELYDIEFINPGSTTTTSFHAHHTRILHVVPEMLESETEGVPVLKAIWNRLMDLDKLQGGSAEMFWRGARPGYQGILDKDVQVSTKTEKGLQDQFDEYENNQRRFIFNEGIEYKALEMQVANPDKHIDVQIQMISARTGIPKRILTGSERGELASSQDETGWLNVIQTRRDDVEFSIIRPFIDICIKYKILPKPSTEEYQVGWLDLFAPSDKDKAEVGKIRADALAVYAKDPLAQMILPPEAFFEWFLGLDETQREKIKELSDAALQEEMQAIAEEIKNRPKPGEEPIEEEIVPKKKIVRRGTKSSITAQMTASTVDWKKVYEDGGAHWMDDLQPSQFAQEFAEQLVEEGKTSLLEIGSANGKDSILFTIAGLNVTGIDIVPEAVEVALENAERVGVSVDFQEGNVEALTFSDESFDAVYSLSVLHSTNMDISVSEIARVLKSNGMVSIFIYSDTKKIDGTEKVFTTLDEFIELFKRSGFEIEDLYTTQEEEYDDAGEKHAIIAIKAKKI
ncbi:hypothetical protein LCGC14_1719900 [marine sediment metagenome]|uniref:Uncharacterized protein n=1 Tax=marine sediment metagenome TaxID=412755 RepID=A0A0F9HD14_9ZZZZ